MYKIIIERINDYLRANNRPARAIAVNWSGNLLLVVTDNGTQFTREECDGIQQKLQDSALFTGIVRAI